ncbi:hypothetical protein ACFL0W_01500 [Nanoarchaeota archaeon]
MKSDISKFLKKNKKKIIIVAVIIVIFIILFLLGMLGAGKDINYIPI